MAASKASEESSKVPPHLWRFHRLALTTEPKSIAEAKAQHSQHVHFNTRDGANVELCPPHWRLKPKRSLRSKLKSLVLKESLRESRDRSSISTLPSFPSHRPALMRMKDSDDYITARAANPRTGMISPSIATPSPRTPDSPGDALKFSRRLSLSPTRELVGGRPSLSLKSARAVRKVNYGENRWRVDAGGWVSNDMPHPASPRETDGEGAGLHVVTPEQNVVLPDDHFIVHMPSAREPQPFRYPGRTAAEIKAFECHSRQAERVRGESYNRRQVPCAGDPLEMRRVSRKETAAHHSSVGFGEEGKFVHGIESKELGVETPFALENGRENFRTRSLLDASKTSKIESYNAAATFAPFPSQRTSPSTIRRVEDHVDILLNTQKIPGAFDGLTLSQEYSVVPTCLRRKAVKSALPPPGNIADSPSDLIKDSSSFGEVYHIAHARLVHPTFAALPKVQRSLSRQNRTSGSKSKQRSLGRDQHPATGAAVRSQRPNARNKESCPPGSRFVSKKPDHDEHIDLDGWPTVNDFFVQIVALQPVLTLATKALAFTAAITMTWRLCSALMQMVEVLLWPLVIPFKILRWVAFGGE